MLVFFLILRQFWQTFRHALRDPEFQLLAMIVGVLLAVGTFFYHQIEGWQWLDSLYFSVITLATVGYGDFSPQTNLGKLFTILYIFLGIGLLVAFFARLAEALTMARREWHGARRSQRSSNKKTIE